MQQEAKYAVKHTGSRADAEPISRRAPASTHADNRPGTAPLRKFAEAMNSSPRVVAQRKLAKAMDSSPRVVAQRKLTERMAAGRAQYRAGPSQLVAPGQRTPQVLSRSEPAPQMHGMASSRAVAAGEITGISGSIPIQLVKKKIRAALAGAGIGGVLGGLGGLGLGAVAATNAWNPIGWALAGAGIGALVGGAIGAYRYRPPRTLRESFEYHSEDLSDEEFSSGEDVELVRAPGKKGERRETVKMHSPATVVKKTALNIRKFRAGEAEEEHTKPMLTKLGSHVYEFMPNPSYKDVGAYRTEAVEGGGYARKGGAKPYRQLGREMDDVGVSEGRTEAELDTNLQDILMERQATYPLADRESRGTLTETGAVFLSDMSRGSAGPEIIDEMFSSPEPYFDRFRDEGSYRPASKGGSKYIQEQTKAKKKKGS